MSLDDYLSTKKMSLDDWKRRIHIDNGGPWSVAVVKQTVSHSFELWPLDPYWHGTIVILSNHPMVEMKTVLYFTAPNPYPIMGDLDPLL